MSNVLDLFKRMHELVQEPDYMHHTWHVQRITQHYHARADKQKREKPA